MLTTREPCNETDPCARLADVLPEWLNLVPLYQGANYSRPDSNADNFSCESFRKLPFISKRDIRKNFPANFLAADASLDSLIEQGLAELEHTAGTSEDRVPLILPLGWWAVQEQRALRRNSLVAAVLDEFPDARRCTISSPVCNSDICYSSTPATFDRILGNSLHLSLNRQPLLWTEAELARMAAEAAEWQPQFLDVDPVYGVCFARYCERHGIRLPSLRFIICSYEFVSVVHRRILQRAFGVPVFNLYGATETGHLLMENTRGQMLPSPETACLEIVDAGADNIGRLIVTTLTNDYMPLIRYRIGDLAERSQPANSSDCTYTVHGREADAFITAAGQRVTTWHIDECFAGLSGFVHYQKVQVAEAEWQLRYVPDAVPPTQADLAELCRRLHQTLGVTGGIELQPAEFLLPEASGKFRLSYPLPPSV